MPDQGAAARISCWRCGAPLGSHDKNRLDRILALVLASAVLWLIGNFAPLVRVNLQGDTVSTTLAGSALALWRSGMEPIAALVLVTAVVLPALYLGTLAYLAAGLLWIEREGHTEGRTRHLPYAGPLLRAAQHAQAWSMLEVFLVGALVAVVRLERVAVVDVRSGLWAIAGLVVAFSTLAGSWHPVGLWARLDRAAKAQ
jgi:paraquat-inducible protein A